MKRKLISVLLCVAMMTFMLAGCGDTGSKDDANNSSSNSANSSQDDTTGGDDDSTSGKMIKVGIINNLSLIHI